MDTKILTGNLFDWQETTLWRQLQDKRTSDFSEVEEVLTVLKGCMPQIQTILMQAGTSPSDFTLHDSNHSYRVAEWMVKVIPGEVLPKLTPYELALLLLSAYLHDIGMTPEQRKVKLHYQYLLTGDKSGLEKTEIEEFQAWLDDHKAGLVPPITRLCNFVSVNSLGVSEAQLEL